MNIHLGAPDPALTVDECLAAGGHCHVRTGETLLSIPEQYVERCKHCGHRRYAIPQALFRYQDAP